VSDTEYRIHRRQRQARETKPTAPEGHRLMTAEVAAATAAAHLQAALDEAGLGEPYQAELEIRVVLVLTPTEAHELASAIVAAIARR
jgi:hypothetical protein